jgi:hypothetical protein
VGSINVSKWPNPSVRHAKVCEDLSYGVSGVRSAVDMQPVAALFTRKTEASTLTRPIGPGADSDRQEECMAKWIGSGDQPVAEALDRSWGVS